MISTTRRRFLAKVGQGMLLASVGPQLAGDLGLCSLWAAEPDTTPSLSFGEMEGLVGLMQDTPVEKLLPAVHQKLRGGVELRTLVSAAALANARTFGGQDYIGFHSFMALVPAFEMSRQMPSDLAALPIYKVLYRNTNRIQAFGGRAKEVLHTVDPEELSAAVNPGEALREATRKADFEAAERRFAAIAKGPPGEAFNHLQMAVEDEVDVHRVVLAWRAWAALELTGEKQAHTLLRQSVRYCVNNEQRIRDGKGSASDVRNVLPRLLDQYKLLGREVGTRRADDGWVEKLSHLVASSARDAAADAVAAALAEGFSPQDIGEAIALAANELVLRDPGRPKEWVSDGKPEGSVHGDSVGVHASDAANAWRNIARVTNQRNAVASLIVAAYHTAGQSGRSNKEFYPTAEQAAAITASEPEALLGELDGAVREKNQFKAAAVVQRIGKLEQPSGPVFSLLLKYAVSEDGALHAEKYFRTVAEEFDRTRPAFRWRQLTALARVTASEYGRPAPGYAQACELVKT